MKRRLLLVVLTLAMLAVACNLPIPNAPTARTTGTPADTPNALTAVALTVAADLTATPALTTTVTPTVTATASATVTSGPPTQTRQPPTQTPQPCDQVGFIQDVTIPDGTKMAPGTVFAKTWRLRNLGTCTWTSSYGIAFFGGDSMGGSGQVNFKGDVTPNSIVDITVEMKAPSNYGKYISYWKLRNARGEWFSLPEGQAVFTQIEVVPQTPTLTHTPSVSVTPTVTPTPTSTITPPPSGVVYDFAANVCAAVWQTAAGSLNCPGTTADSGYVMKLQNPRLESGANETAPVLLTQPQNVTDGLIFGTFVNLTIQQGHHFRAVLGCLDGATACDVEYQLNVTQGSQTTNLGHWEQKYDGSVQGVDVDLSSLAGQTVSLTLVVAAHGSAQSDQAVWVNPRIVTQP